MLKSNIGAGQEAAAYFCNAMPEVQPFGGKGAPDNLAEWIVDLTTKVPTLVFWSFHKFCHAESACIHMDFKSSHCVSIKWAASWNTNKPGIGLIVTVRLCIAQESMQFFQLACCLLACSSLLRPAAFSHHEQCRSWQLLTMQALLHQVE